MGWYRIDNRLIHGQVIESWLPYTEAEHLVVCNKALALDQLRQQIMLLAVPARIEVAFAAPEELEGILARLGGQSSKFLVIFADCADAKMAWEAGVHFTTLNIGNLHYAAGKRQICEHVALSVEDAACLHLFADSGVALDFRCVPNDTINLTDW